LKVNEKSDCSGKDNKVWQNRKTIMRKKIREIVHTLKKFENIFSFGNSPKLILVSSKNIFEWMVFVDMPKQHICPHRGKVL